ncbi:YdcF family protein [Clostridium sp.]|uniref:YdcF family protein n=1 Tax=Clostridium sp. TaxID=1506 RepID=UPI00262F14AF|nr:YdcF family protein [uncultured Clostridium sp.]
MEKTDLQEVADNLNILGDFLSKRDIEDLSKAALIKKYGIKQVDLLILLGGSIVYGCEIAGKTFSNGIAKQLMIVGGEGHTTSLLRTAISERYPSIITQNRMEADMISDLLYEKYSISKNDIFMEKQSTNCGENALFSLRLAKDKGIKPKNVIIMQDSSMQLRMDATYKREWRECNTTFIGYASYRAHVIIKEGKLVFEDNNICGMWSMEHYITLLLGEIPRLHDTSKGYGPKGKNYIVHVDIPSGVLEAFENLKMHYGKYVRKAWQKSNK